MAKTFDPEIMSKPMIDLMSIPALEDVLPAMDDIKGRLPEFVEPLKYFFGALAWTGGDLVGHQLFAVGREEKLPEGYYGRRMIFSPVALLLGKVLSDSFGGPRWVKSLTMGASAAIALQTPDFFTKSTKFNVISILAGSAVLIPLTFLLMIPKD